jgi:hypothetical protein
MVKRAAKPSTPSDSTPAWKNPAWIAAVTGLVTAAATGIGLIVANIHDDGKAAPVVTTTAVPPSVTSVAGSSGGGGSPTSVPDEACGPATCTDVSATIRSFNNGQLLTKPQEADLQRANELQAQNPDFGAVQAAAFGNDGPVAAGVNALDIGLAGRGTDPVVITNARVNVVKTTSIGSGTYVTPQQEGCGAGPDEYRMNINLDVGPPVVMLSKRNDDSVTGSDVLKRPWAVSVTRNDVIDLTVWAYAFQRDVEWTLDLDFSVAGHLGTMHIDDKGAPFHVTGVTAANPRYTQSESAVARDQANDGKYGSCVEWPAGVPSG